MDPPLVVEALDGLPVSARRMEMVERKGVGHPDAICDAIAEDVAVALNRMYVAELGAPVHFNVDKALLAAGGCEKGFGWGRLTRPMELTLGDRATFEVGGRRLPVEETAREAVGRWLGANLPKVKPDRDVTVRVALAPTSAELQSVFAPAATAGAANDTSGASGYAPLTPTEELVLGVERFLNGDEFKAAFPDTGRDVKVFAVRCDERVAVTVAMPLLCLAVASEAAYFRRKGEILAALAARFGGSALAITWALNALDRRGAGADGAYVTLTGTSAEDADSGQVGRGNRANGLIAFSRPAGGEAAAGKNAQRHPGKIYSVLSHRLARLIHARRPEIREVYVHLASRIGDPVDRPWTGVQLVLPPGMALGDATACVAEIVGAELARLPQFIAELTRGEHALA